MAFDPHLVTDEEVMRALGGLDGLDAREGETEFPDEDTPLPAPVLYEPSDPVISSGGAERHEVAGMVESFDGPEPPSAEPLRLRPAPLLTIRPASGSSGLDALEALAAEEGQRPPPGPGRRWVVGGAAALCAAAAVVLLIMVGKQQAEPSSTVLAVPHGAQKATTTAAPGPAAAASRSVAKPQMETVTTAAVATQTSGAVPSRLPGATSGAGSVAAPAAAQRTDAVSPQVPGTTRSGAVTAKPLGLTPQPPGTPHAVATATASQTPGFAGAAPPIGDVALRRAAPPPGTATKDGNGAAVPPRADATKPLAVAGSVPTAPAKRVTAASTPGLTAPKAGGAPVKTSSRAVVREPEPAPAPLPVAASRPAPRRGERLVDGSADDLLRRARQMRRSNPAAALTLVEQALSAAPMNGPALVLKAEMLLDGDQADEALAATDKALAADSANADAWRTRGKALLGSDGAQAKASLQKYLELRPDAPDAETIRSALDSL
jgi:hypothetical protein